MGTIAGRPAHDSQPAAGGAVPSIATAIHELLWVTSAAEVRDIVTALVRELGGDVGPADTDPAETLPIDVSFGEGPPLVPVAPLQSVARLVLEHHLPAFVEDARRAVDIATRQALLQRNASIDGLTGVANRRTVDRALGRLAAGDVVVQVDLDHFQRFNDAEGHAAGDQILRTFGAFLTGELRARDFCGRYGGEEFVLVIAGLTAPDALLSRLRQAWEGTRPRPVTFSAGWATVPAGGAPAGTVMAAVDRALHRAKAAGRDCALPSE